MIELPPLPGPRIRRRLPVTPTAQDSTGLTQIIENNVLPHLLTVHRNCRRPQASVATQLTVPERLVALALPLTRDHSLEEQLRALLDEKLPLDTLLLDVLAPAARHLGRLWEEDEISFIDVTIALGRLHSLARALCVELEVGDVPANGRCVLLLPCSGETHLLGLTLLASFFREAGWQVVLLGDGYDDSAALIQAERFDLIGIPLSSDIYLAAMPELIAALRGASRNPAIRVIVGGPPFLREPGLVAAIGADISAKDGRDAVRVAEALFNGRPWLRDCS